jgi:membrane-bound serine protease (ClpP class)
VILQLDTPGGLDTSMRDIIKAILASPVPVATYVAPNGARAASAGTYILYASHLAAMAPATNLGAATPVSIGGDSGHPPKPVGNAPDKAPPEAAAPGAETTLERKAINDAVSYIRALAELRGRDVAFAESAVRSATSLTASEALQQHVIELIAKDVPDLLRQAHGRKLQVAGRDIVLDTSNLSVERIEPDWRTQLLSALTHPTIAYGLLLIGIYGLLLEGYNPGAILPGVAGAIALLLALYGFQLLSVNYAGLGLVAVGVGLMIAEFFVPAFGSLVIGGLTAFVIGSIILLDTDVPGLQVARPLIYGVAISGAIVALAIVVLAARAQRRPASAGVEAMIGTTAEVIGEFTGRGVVRYGGELWNARAAGPLCAGQRVRIVGIDGLVLSVEPLSSHT